MADSAQKLLLAIWDYFPLALSSVGLLVVLSLVARALRMSRKSPEELTLEKVPMLFWLSPVYVWGIETIYGLLMVLDAPHGVHPLRPYQQLLFTNLYCLLLVLCGVFISLVLLHGKAAAGHFRGPLSRSLYMSVAGVLVLEILLFILAFRYIPGAAV